MYGFTYTPYGVLQWTALADPLDSLQSGGENGGITMKVFKSLLIYLCLNEGVTTHTSMGFVICSKKLWDESIGNDSNYLRSKPSHIIKRLNEGGSNGYIN
jgi:hypothetical protein